MKYLKWLKRKYKLKYVLTLFNKLLLIQQLRDKYLLFIICKITYSDLS